MATKSLAISEARRRLSALVESVARGGGPVAIGRYGRARAVLVAAVEYDRLRSTARSKPGRPRSLEGTLTLACSPEELMEESRRLGELWLAGLHAPGHGPRRSRRRR